MTIKEMIEELESVRFKNRKVYIQIIDERGDWQDVDPALRLNNDNSITICEA